MKFFKAQQSRWHSWKACLASVSVVEVQLQQWGHTVHKEYANKEKAKNWLTVTDMLFSSGAAQAGLVVESGSVDILQLSDVKADESHLASSALRQAEKLHPLSVRLMGPSFIYVRTSHRVFAGRWGRRERWKSNYFFFQYTSACHHVSDK